MLRVRGPAQREYAQTRSQGQQSKVLVESKILVPLKVNILLFIVIPGFVRSRLLKSEIRAVLMVN